MASFSFLRGPFSVPASLRRGTKLYDFVMGLPLIFIYAGGAIAKLQSLSALLSTVASNGLDYDRLIKILLDVSVLSVALVFVVSVVLRPPAIARAAGLMPRIAALAGTYLAVGLLLASPQQPAGWITSASLLFVLCGTSFSTYAILYLGRSVSLMAEARKLVTGGPYRLVRHPLYLGEQVAIFGSVLQGISFFSVSLFALQICFQLYRMSCEEKILAATFPEYVGYAQRTYRILPSLY